MSLCPKQVSSEVMNSWEDEICTFCRLFYHIPPDVYKSSNIFPSSLAVRCLRFFIWHFHYVPGVLESNCILSWWMQPEDGLGHCFLHSSALSAVPFWSFPWNASFHSLKPALRKICFHGSPGLKLLSYCTWSALKWCSSAKPSFP